MRYIIYAVALSLALLILTVPVFAAEKPNYFGFGIGAFIPTGDLDEGNIGVAGEVKGGTYLSTNLALEFGVGGAFTSYDQDGLDATGYYEDDSAVNVLPLTVTLKGIIPVDDHMELYGGVGFGMYYATAIVQRDYPGLGLEFEDEDSDSVVGAHGVFGANVYPGGNQSFFVNIQAKYTVTEEAKFKFYDVDAGYSGIYVLNSQSKTDLNGVSLTAGVGFRF